MITQFTGNAEIGKNPELFMQEYHRMSQFVSIYTEQSRPTPKTIIEQFTYMFKRKGIKRFYIDNMSTLDLGKNSLEDQGQAMDEFRMFVNEFPVHLSLVVHPRKESSDFVGTVAQRADVKGSSTITDFCHNLIVVHRYSAKGDNIFDMRKDNRSELEIETYDKENPDAFIRVHKNRFLGTEPRMEAWFNNPCKLFMGYRGHPVGLDDVARSREPEWFS
jgi:hypothetical protein